MPQMPTTADTCIKGMNPYCEYAIDHQLAPDVRRARRHSAVTSVYGASSGARALPCLGDAVRSMTKGSVTIVALTTSMSRYPARGMGNVSRSAIATEAYNGNQRSVAPDL